jgi:hypothetical protein
MTAKLIASQRKFLVFAGCFGLRASNRQATCRQAIGAHLERRSVDRDEFDDRGCDRVRPHRRAPDEDTAGVHGAESRLQTRSRRARLARAANVDREFSSMWRCNASEAAYDLVLTGARICDPATRLDRHCDLAVNGDRIAAVGSGLASHARQVIELDGKLVTAGWVDLHVHVFEWMTTFGLPPDEVGVHSGVTTAVDQGGAGAYTILAFKHYIADRALTDIRCFPSINSAGTLRGGLAGPTIHTPEVVDVELLVAEVNAHPHLVRGFGEIHAESGAFSRWGFDVVRKARLPNDQIWRNDRYQVHVRDMAPAVTDDAVLPMVQMSIKRIDKQPIRDWRDVQQIKNQLVGPECEAVELYPAESGGSTPPTSISGGPCATRVFAFPLASGSALLATSRAAAQCSGRWRSERACLTVRGFCP